MNKAGPSLFSFISQTHEREKNLWRNNVILLVALVTLVFLMPLFHEHGEIVTRLVLGTVVISGAFAAEFSRKLFGILLVTAILVVIAMVLALAFPEARILNITGFLLVTSFLILSTIALVSHVSGAKQVDRSTIVCAINSYLLMGITGSVMFIIADLASPQSFVNLGSQPGELGEYFYFGFVTLTTLGYGDISPISPLARSFSIFLALTGQLYLVIIMALIIGKFLNSKNKQD